MIYQGYPQDVKSQDRDYIPVSYSFLLDLLQENQNTINLDSYSWTAGLVTVRVIVRFNGQLNTL